MKFAQNQKEILSPPTIPECSNIHSLVKQKDALDGHNPLKAGNWVQTFKVW